MQSPSQDSRFRRLYEEHRAAVMAYCLRRASRSDAMDAVAETFVVAWRRIDRLPRDDAERSWLYAVALRVLANQRRSSRRLGNLRSKLGGVVGVAQPDPEEVLVRAEDERRLLKALARLRPADQELLRLVTWEEHPRDQVAQMLGISRAALDQRLHRAVSRLRIEHGASQPVCDVVPRSVEGEAR